MRIWYKTRMNGIVETEGHDNESGSEEDAFVSLSIALTGFDGYELAATGSTAEYQTWLSQSFPAPFAELLGRWRQIERHHPDPQAREWALRREILADPRLGPFARNIALLWYVAGWAELPPEWSQVWHLPRTPSRVFASAYAESLVWKAAGTHPVGANPTGFGSWALPPGNAQGGTVA